MKYATIFAIWIALAVILLCSFPAATAAQNASSALAASTAKEQTNIPGVKIFADRPVGFSPLTATDEQLSTYGLPPRPDKQANPQGYAQWARAMTSLKYRASATLVAKPYSSTNLKLVNNQANQPSVQVNGAPTQYYSTNWSGVANTNNLTKWNDNTSFNYIQSITTVPAAQPPFGACWNPTNGPFLTAVWNGIDGANNGDVLQGGSLSYADCNGDALQSGQYIGWVEWYPSYSILEIVCGTGTAPAPCPVYPGDNFLVITFGAPGTANQYVYVEDGTEGWYGSFELAWQQGPGLVGSSAEWIVERPCCITVGEEEDPVPLANYISQAVSNSFSSKGNGNVFFPGSQAASTWVIDMLDDNADQIISDVEGQGTAGFQGKTSLWLEATGCAFAGGCTP